MKCILCGVESTGNPTTAVGDFQLKCPHCGNYIINQYNHSRLTYLFNSNHELGKIKHLISSYIYEQNLNDNEYTVLDEDQLLGFINNRILPFTIAEKIDKYLNIIHKKTEYFGHVIRYNPDNYVEAYCVNSEEFSSLISVMKENEYIKNGSVAYSYQITFKGINHLTEINKNTNSLNCFVAMWFCDEMFEAYSQGIEKAIHDTGYNPVNISIIQHNDNITDQILANIRKSKFVIADFTGNRGGVYYEAGFASGLGIPVIWTCKEEYFNQMIKLNKSGLTFSTEDNQDMLVKSQIHFDISHFNFIVWSNHSDLYNKLKNRIEATIT